MTNHRSKNFWDAFDTIPDTNQLAQWLEGTLCAADEAKINDWIHQNPEALSLIHEIEQSQTEASFEPYENASLEKKLLALSPSSLSTNSEKKNLLSLSQNKLTFFKRPASFFLLPVGALTAAFALFLTYSFSTSEITDSSDISEIIYQLGWEDAEDNIS